MFITDVLQVVIFIGLLRMRRHGAGTFALGRLIWKQVRQWSTWLSMVLCFC
jgi:hypothetical protein